MEHQKLARLKLAVLLFGVFISSFGTLAFEISLTRIFSVMLDYQYTFLIVSVAVFGLGIGGIIAQAFSSKMSLNETFGKLAIIAIGSSLSVSFLAFSMVSVIGSNLLVAAIVLFVPFLFAGTLLAVIYRFFASNSNVLYFADLIGASTGALAIVFLLNWAGASFGVLLVSIIISVASVSFAVLSKKKTVILPVLAGILLLAFFVQFSSNSNVWNIQPISSQGKEEAAFLSDPTIGATVVDSRWTDFGRVDLVQIAADPHNKVIFVDGGAGTSLYHFDGDLNSTDNNVSSLRNSTQYFPYNVVRNGTSLVIGPGGGLDVLTSLLAGMDHIYAVEVNPGIVSLVRDYSSYAGGIYSDYSNVHVSVDEGRSYVRRSNQKYDIIMLDIPVTRTSQGTFGYAMAENYLFTTESFKDYLDHLDDDGFLAIVAHSELEIYRLVSIAFKVLSAQGLKPQDIMNRLAVVGGMGASHDHSAFPVFMLKKSPITQNQSSLISAKAAQFGLTASFVPPNKGEPYASFDPVLKALYFDTPIEQLISTANFDITASTDDNPFFYKFDLGIPSMLLPLLVGAVVLALAFSCLYINNRRRRETTYSNGALKVLKGRFSTFRLFHFAAIGLGFMLIEIAMIQKFVLFLGQPTFAIAVSLFALLLASGLGSFFSRKWRGGKEHNVFKVALVIAALTIGYIITLPFVFNVFLSYSQISRFLISFALIFPLGFLMGIPFPTILGAFKKESDNDVAWMWGINGAFSVLGGVLALVIAMSLGYNATLLSGALAYLGVFLAGRIREQNNAPGKVKWLNPRKNMRTVRGIWMIRLNYAKKDLPYKALRKN